MLKDNSNCKSVFILYKWIRQYDFLNTCPENPIYEMLIIDISKNEINFYGRLKNLKNALMNKSLKVNTL